LTQVLLSPLHTTGFTDPARILCGRPCDIGVERAGRSWEQIPVESTANLADVADRLRSRRAFSRRGLYIGSLCAALLSVLSATYLVWLPYSTSRILRVAEADVAAEPAERSALGPVQWDYELFRRAPELETFRTAFAPTCGQKLGLEAARCVSDFLSSRSPRGNPSSEFVELSYDPSAALSAHLGGEPGHCTVRSSVTATALLAMGVPARVVQVLPRNARGHNLLEVWDQDKGWLLFDPFFDSSMLHDGSFVPAVTLAHASSGLTWRRPKSDSPDPNVFAGSTVQFPEPWLYTRVGPRCATWPFRGCFAQIGPEQWTVGTAQRWALDLAIGCFTLAVALFGLALFRGR